MKPFVNITRTAMTVACKRNVDVIFEDNQIVISCSVCGCRRWCRCTSFRGYGVARVLLSCLLTKSNDVINIIGKKPPHISDFPSIWCIFLLCAYVRRHHPGPGGQQQGQKSQKLPLTKLKLLFRHLKISRCTFREFKSIKGRE